VPIRSEAAVGMKQGRGKSKKRIRKVEDTGMRISQRVGEDALESPILTRKVWDELYEIFKLHFSTEMPFLHPPSFRNRVRQASFPRDPSITTSGLENGRVLLLGVLTLTARFHPDLVAHHSPNQDDPLAASEYYATALETEFGPAIRNLTNPSLESIQALLILGLYEWGQTRGLSAWLYVGLAVRLAQSMGLAYEDDPDNWFLNASSQNQSKDGTFNPSASPCEDVIEKEVRRRTLWSCFIMDRMLAAGRYRPIMMSVDGLRVQLPCSDDQFVFVRHVQTGFLNSDWLKLTSAQHCASVNDDGMLSRYIRLVEIFGRFSEWKYAGGRKTERLPPWHESTEFFKLRRELHAFHDSLPSDLTWTEANLLAYIEKGNVTTYASLHTLYSICLVMLHKEYIPFIPLRCKKPSGPLDEPIFSEATFDIPPGFWEASAKEIMIASRDIIDIVSICRDNNALPESPQICFAVWQAAFFCVYTTYFPQMDTAQHLLNQEVGDLRKDEGFLGQTKKILSDMVPRLRIVKGYLKSVENMYGYFNGVIRDYKVYKKEMGCSGGLKDMDYDVPSHVSNTIDQKPSPALTNDLPGTSVIGELIKPTPEPRPNGSWIPGQQSPSQSSNVSSALAMATRSLDSTSHAAISGSNQRNDYNVPASHDILLPSRPLPNTVEQKFEKWIRWQERISMNAGLDNFAQNSSWEMTEAVGIERKGTEYREEMEG
jgi:hypothetical protein